MVEVFFYAIALKVVKSKLVMCIARLCVCLRLIEEP